MLSRGFFRGGRFLDTAIVELAVAEEAEGGCQS